MLRSLLSRLLPILVLSAPLARAQTFNNPPIIPTANDPVQLGLGDFNGDGILDLVYLDAASGQSSNNTLHLLTGKADGTFIHGQDVPLPFGYCGCVMKVGDITQDGKLDVVLAANAAGAANIYALAGNGDGTFAAPVVSTIPRGNSGNYPQFGGVMLIADLNGDGAPDLALADSANYSITIFTGDKTGSFQYATYVFNGSGPNSVYATDLNGDGNVDLLVPGALGADFTVYLGNGNGTFGTGVRYGDQISGVLALKDLDGDGHLDVIARTWTATSTQVTYQLVFIRGNADGTFADPKVLVTPFSGSVIESADYNGDGILDLAITSPVGVGIMLGQGNLTFKPPTFYVIGTNNSSLGFPRNSVAGNLGTNGHRDFAICVEGGILLLMGNGDGTFTSVPFYDVGQSVGATAVTDFNGDGNMDIAATVAADYPRVLMGKGDGTFQLATDQNLNYGTAQPAINISAANFSRTSVVDLVAPSAGTTVPSGTPAVLFGKGDGTFSVPVAQSNGSTLVADFNGDGLSDMVGLSGTSIITLLGQRSGTFNSASTPLRISTFETLTAAGDVNHDGKPDLLEGDIYGTEIWLGNGDGTFTYKSTLPALVDGGRALASIGSAVIADFDGDGNPDLVLGSGNSNYNLPIPDLSVFYGNGDGTFQAPTLLPTSHGYPKLAVADIDKDGKPDLILNDTQGIAVIRSLGGRRFGPEAHYVAGMSINTVSVADVNHDGYPDLVVADTAGTIVSVLLNQPQASPYGGITPNGAITVSPEPSIQTQTFQVTLSLAAAQGGPQPTGVVTFTIGGVFQANVALTNGVATFNAQAGFPVGFNVVVAQYSGDQTYGPTTFRIAHTVSPPVYSTTTTLVLTPATVLTSQTVQMKAIVTSTGPLGSGTVTFLEGTKTLGSSPLDSSGIAIFDTATQPAGTHNIVASFSGFVSTNQYSPMNILPSVSAPVVLTITSNATATVLTSSSSSPTAGTVVTLTAKVTSVAGTPFGGVTFFDGTTVLGTSSLANNIATFSTVSLSKGAHSLSATYNAAGTFGSSSTQAQSVNVQAASARLLATVTAISSANITPAGDLAVTARVDGPARAPTGAVTFLLDGKTAGSAAVSSSGVATLSLPAFSALGQHVLYASYAGDEGLAPSASPALVEMWPAGGGAKFALSVDSGDVTVTHLSPATIRVNVIAETGLSGTIMLQCAEGVPEGYSCLFSPASFSSSGTSVLTLQSTQATARDHSGRWLWLNGTMLAFLILCPSIRRRSSRLFVVLLLIAVVGVSACNSPKQSNVGQLRVLVVNATIGTGSATSIQSVQIPVRIQP